MVRPEEGWNAEVISAINNRLELLRQQKRSPELVKQIKESVA